MTHKCSIDGSQADCVEHDAELWVKEYGDGRQQKGRTYKVNFCPECGFKLPNKIFYNFLRLPYQEPDESISKFSSALSTAISEMNYNVELIKAFMISQSTQNECFIFNEMELRKRISELEGIKNGN